MTLGRLDEAKQHAELAAKSAPATAHENLAQIALARKDYAEAQRQAALAAQADPQLPLPVYVRGLIQYHEQHYAEAVPLLLQARDAWAARTIQSPDLRFYLGDALARLERYPEAETAFLEELRIFPGSVRARAGLALLYQATGKTDRVERIIDDMLRVAPSPRTYETAAELWRIFGQADRAAAVRAAARAKFGAATGR
jgi:tetratricopeptide (TPR) repeat protein